MTDYRRIDADGLVTHARALEQLAGELRTTAGRVSSALAIVGRDAPTASIADAALWMDTWASTMTGKAAIAEQAVALPVVPEGVPATAAMPEAGRWVLRSVRIPRWVERPLLGVEQVTRMVTRAVAKTTVVREIRTFTERVLERVPAWHTVTRYREILRPATVWRAVSVVRLIPRQYTVFETQYRRVSQFVSETVPVVRNVTHFLWNGWEFAAYTMPAVTYRQITRLRYTTVPVRVARTVTHWVRQRVTEYRPLTEWRTVIEPYQVTVQGWVDRWVSRPVQRAVAVPRRVIAHVTRSTTILRSKTETRGEWIWDERAIIEQIPAPAGATGQPVGPRETRTAPTGALRPSGDRFVALNEIGATKREVAAYQGAAAAERESARWSTGGTPAGDALKRFGAAALSAYDSAQQGSLGLFTGGSPTDSVRRALQGVTGERRFSSAELGFARLAEPGSTLQTTLGALGAQLVDPLTLLTAGGGGAIRAFTAAAITAGTAVSGAARQLGATDRQQDVAHLISATIAGLAASSALARQAAARAARTVEAANTLRVTRALADARLAESTRLSARFEEPVAAARALRSAPPASDDAGEIAALLARDATHVEGPARRVVLGKAIDGGGYVGEARANGGVWYESAAGVYEAAGADATWATNEAFLRQQMKTGVGRIEFHALDRGDVAAFHADTPFADLPARGKEGRFLSRYAGAQGYVEKAGDYRLIDILPADVGAEVGSAAVAGGTAEAARVAGLTPESPAR